MRQFGISCITLALCAIGALAFPMLLRAAEGKRPGTEDAGAEDAAEMRHTHPRVCRGKFRCDSVKKTAYGEEAVFSAVCDDGIPENTRYHASTPTGALTIFITNSVLFGFYVPGECYYLDMTPAPK